MRSRHTIYLYVGSRDYQNTRIVFKKTDVEKKKKKCGFDKIKQHAENPDTLQLDKAIQQTRDEINTHFENFEKR